jgi:hypothetical protein
VRVAGTKTVGVAVKFVYRRRIGSRGEDFICAKRLAGATREGGKRSMRCAIGVRCGEHTYTVTRVQMLVSAEKGRKNRQKLRENVTRPETGVEEGRQ